MPNNEASCNEQDKPLYTQFYQEGEDTQSCSGRSDAAQATTEDVAEFLEYILLGLECSEDNLKAICVYIIAYLERIIEKTD